MQIFLTVLLWLLIVFLALIIFVLFVPVGAGIEINYDKPKIWLKILFLKFQIYPQKPKKANKKAKAKADSQEDTKKPPENDAADTKVMEQASDGQAGSPQNSEDASKKQKKDTGIKRKIDIEKLIELIKSASGAMKIAFKGIFFTKIEIVYPVHKPDSAENAIAFGETQAYFGAIAATLQNFFHLSFKRVQIIPDFTNEHKYKRYFYCNIWSTTFIMLVAAVYLLIALRREKII